MTIALVSNYFNHHQVAVCDELFRLSNGNFTFIETEDMPAFRKKLGYKVIERSYVLRVWADKHNKANALAICEKVDVLIAGGGGFVVEYEKARLMKGKLTLEYAERSLKKGWINLFSPTNLKMQLYYHLLFHNKPLLKLCASAYTAHDMYVQRAFRGRCYKYGYFPQFQALTDFDNFLNRKFSSKKMRLVWCARFISWKHPEMVVRLAERLRDDGYDFEINMVGSGELRDVTTSELKEKNLCSYVHLLGSMSNKEVMDEMAQSHIFLLTSDKNEGWGVVLNEAMGRGCCPVVSKMVGSAPYLINHKKDGLLFNSGDLDELIENVKYLLDNPNDCQQMAKCAYHKISTLWSPQNAANRLYEFCESYINGKHLCYEDGPMSIAQLL